MDPFRVVSGASRGRLLLSWAGRRFLSRVVPCGTIWLFTNEAGAVSEAAVSEAAVSEAAAPSDQGEIQSVNLHGVWIVS